MNPSDMFEKDDKIIALARNSGTLSDDAVRAIRDAYAQGRADTLALLGIEESDLPGNDGPTAWAV